MYSICIVSRGLCVSNNFSMSESALKISRLSSFSLMACYTLLTDIQPILIDL